MINNHSFVKAVFGIAFVFTAVPALAGNFLLDLPLGTFESVDASQFESNLTTNGFGAASSARFSTSQSVGLGYQLDGGLRFAATGTLFTAVNDRQQTGFVALDSQSAKLHIVYDLTPASMHHLVVGGSLGGTSYRYTMVGTVNNGVATEFSFDYGPSLAYEYGGQSVRLALNLGYLLSSGSGRKSYGSPGQSDLVTDQKFRISTSLIFVL